MADLAKEIRNVLSQAGSMTASEIGKAIGCSKSTINRFIYYCDEFERDSSDTPRWSIKGGVSLKSATAIESNPVVMKLQNREGAKTFSQKDFDDLADWEYGTAFVGKYQYETSSGNIIECDSKSEILLLEYLEENGLVKDIGGQTLRIGYDTSFRLDRDYWPDIVALTQDNRIAIFEVKPATAMDNHTNMEKYRALAEYCKEHGFMYVMIDPAADFMSFEELRDFNVCRGLWERFKELNNKPHTAKKPYKFFDDDDVKEWFARYGDGCTKKEFYLQVHSLVIRYDWYNFSKNGFKAFSRPVKLNSDYEVIDYI